MIMQFWSIWPPFIERLKRKNETERHDDYYCRNERFNYNHVVDLAFWIMIAVWIVAFYVDENRRIIIIIIILYLLLIFTFFRPRRSNNDIYLKTWDANTEYIIVKYPKNDPRQGTILLCKTSWLNFKIIEAFMWSIRESSSRKKERREDMQEKKRWRKYLTLVVRRKYKYQNTLYMENLDE